MRETGTPPLSVTVEPLDEQRCKFIVNLPVTDEGRVVRYTSAAEAVEAPLARAIFEVPGVCDVVVTRHVITVTKSALEPWEALAPAVQYAIETAVRHSAQGAAHAPAGSPVDDDRMYELVEEIFEAQINPAVAQHGGRVELIDVQEGVVVLRMLGGCHGCGMANVTLRQGIEAALRRSVPGFAGLKDVTDHASGRNPYFTPATK